MMLRRLVCFGALLLVAAYVVTPVWAYEDNGVPVIEGYESSDVASAPTDSSSSLKQRLRRMEQQLQNQANLLERVNELQQTVQALEGKLDEQSHEIKQLKEQQQNYYKDLDRRISKTGTSSSEPSSVEANAKKEKSATNNSYIVDADSEVAAGEPSGSKYKSDVKKPETVQTTKSSEDTSNSNKVTDNLVPAGDRKGNQEEKRYLAAYEMIKSKQFDKALPLMKDFIREFPESRYSANAHYWIGEILLIQGDADSAKTEFQIVTTKYPNSTKVPDAHLKLGAIYADKGLIEKARTELVKVQQKYPDTAAAKLATARLEALSE